MAAGPPRPIRDALREETRPLVVGRLRWTLLISIIGLGFSALSDLRGAPVRYDLIALKLAGAVAQAAAVGLLMLLRHSSWRRLTAAAVAAWIVACATVAVNGHYTADPLMPMFLLPLMVLGASIVFPWGVGPQLAVTLIASAIVLPDALGLGTNLIVSIYSAFAVSIYLAATFERDQQARKAIELLQAGHQHALEHIAADAPLADVCGELLETIRQQVPDAMCAIVLLDGEARELHCVTASGLPDDFRRAIERMAVDSDVARSIAAAAVAGQRTIAADITSDAGWSTVRALALSHGLRASWSEPILSAERSPLGAIAVSYLTPRAPSERELALVGAAARMLGVALERYEAHRQLERYVRALEDARVQAEEQSVQLAEARDQALASVKARSQFLANMSHEIRTPLNGIIGTTEILLDTELDATQQQFLRILSQCGEHLLDVINDVLDLSKIEAGKVELEHIGFDLCALVEEVADVFATRAQEKGIELATSMAPQLDGTMKGDPSRLRQVLVNLVGNAIKFTERGEVVIDAQLLRENAGNQCIVWFSVRDTGIGIPPERQGAVFESFTQADGSTTRDHGGTGLGLTISRELVHRMGGEIGLESAVGYGSTFWIEVPLERAPDAPAMPRATVGEVSGRHVLVVDDTATNRMILRQSLQHFGCRVEEAASGEAALALLHAEPEPFDLVILDMHMGGLDGVATARLMKATPRFANLPLILLSSLGGEREAREVGFAAIVTKPVHRSSLLNALCSALGSTAPEPERRLADRLARPRPLGLRVLLAEDNRVNQLVAERLLAKLDCRTDIVENGRAAVEAAARTRYDVVLMDIQMPTMDGFEATALIRRSEADGEHVPVIAMTAHAMEGDRERCLDAGMDGYISKPVTLAELAQALSPLVEKRAAPLSQDSQAV